MRTTLDLTQISIDELDQIADLQTLDTWTKSCKACTLREESDQVTFASGSFASPIMMVGMNPGFCEDATGIPFCGQEELQASRCVSCTNYTWCFDWQTNRGADYPRTKSCKGYSPNPPNTPDFIVPITNSIGPFKIGGVRSAGQLLDDVLKALGIDRKKLFITNSALCKTQSGDPKPEHILSCSRIRIRAQRILKPKVIIALGRLAIKNYLSSQKPLNQIHGQVLEWIDNGTKLTVVPTYHPSAILRKMMEFSRNPDLSTRQHYIDDINKEKWFLYSDLGTAFNLLSSEDLQSLLLPGITLVDNKLKLRTKV